MSEQEPGVGLKQLFLRGKGGSWVLVGVLKAGLCMTLPWSMVGVPQKLEVLPLGHKLAISTALLQESKRVDKFRNNVLA